MKRLTTNLRAELILVFLLLAVVPLTGIVLYSYASSIRAFHNAVSSDAERLASEMNDRLAGVKADLARGVERLGALPSERFVAIPGAGDDFAGRSQAEWRDVLKEVAGDAAPLIETLEFAPRDVEPPLMALGDGPIPGVPSPQAAPTDFEELASALAAGAARRFIISLEEDEAADSESSGEEPGETASAPDADLPAEPLTLGEKFALGFRIADRVFEEIERSRTTTAPERPVPAPRPSPLEDGLSDAEATLRINEFRSMVVEDGATVGQISARIRPARLIGSVLSRTPRDRGEIPFAVDAAGELHFIDPEDRQALAGLDIPELARVAEVDPETSLGEFSNDEWVLATRPDHETGLTFGIARPVGRQLMEMRRISARNFGVGLGLIVLALLGILPLSARITRNLAELSVGADRLAAGDLAVRVPVRSRNELGRLATTFNRMARDLSSHQDQLLAEERRRKEEDVSRRLLAAEDARKSRELEEARRFQLSLLPTTLPALDAFDIAVLTRTATEVGGDYYDFRVVGEDLTIAIGDATGHGAAAGTMVTVIKSLFTALPSNDDLPGFLVEASRTVRSMRLGRMAMALSVLRLERDRITLAAAGMPPMLIHRAATGQVEEVAIEALPLGAMETVSYEQVRTAFGPGDTMLLMSDGFPELPSPQGDILGYEGAIDLFEAALGETADDLIRGLAEATNHWAGEGPPHDDLTFVAVRRR